MQFRLEFFFSRHVDPGALDTLIEQMQTLLDSAIGDGHIDVTGAEIEDYDLQFEIYD